MSLDPMPTAKALRRLAAERTGIETTAPRLRDVPQDGTAKAPGSPAVAAKGGEDTPGLSPLTLWIPRPPDNANARGHSKALNREKRAYLAVLDTRLVSCWHMPKPGVVPMKCAMIEATYYVRDRRSILDTDNAVRRLKPVVDWLVTRGFLAGDTPDHLEWTIPEQVVIADPTTAVSLPHLCSVRITLTPIPDE